MPKEFSTAEILLELRSELENIRTSDAPVERDKRKMHEIIVTKAFSYLCELDAVEDYLDKSYIDNYTIATHDQVDALMDKYQHIFHHCGKFVKVIEIIVKEKRHLFLALTQISDL